MRAKYIIGSQELVRREGVEGVCGGLWIRVCIFRCLLAPPYMVVVRSDVAILLL